jgi:hypothetical protein
MPGVKIFERDTAANMAETVEGGVRKHVDWNGGNQRYVGALLSFVALSDRDENTGNGVLADCASSGRPRCWFVDNRHNSLWSGYLALQLNQQFFKSVSDIFGLPV